MLWCEKGWHGPHVFDSIVPFAAFLVPEFGVHWIEQVFSDHETWQVFAEKESVERRALYPNNNNKMKNVSEQERTTYHPSNFLLQKMETQHWKITYSVASCIKVDV